MTHEIERKSRQQNDDRVESPVKNSLTDRSNYYKSSVLYSSAT